MAKQTLSSAQKEELTFLNDAVDVTTDALTALVKANIDGHYTERAQVASVATNLVALSDKIREILAPKQ